MLQPATLKARLLAAAGVAAVAAAGGFAAGWGWRDARCDAAAATTRVSALQQKVVELEGQRDALASVINRQQEATNAAANLARRARADAAAADRAADSLRQHVARVAGQCSAAAAVGQAGAEPGAVLAELFGRLEAAGRELAADADRARIAGQLCERSYDALSTQHEPAP